MVEMYVRYIATVGTHLHHILDDKANIVSPRKFKILDVVLLYSFMKGAEENVKNETLRNVKLMKDILESKDIPCLVKEVDEPYDFSRNVQEFRKLILPWTIINVTGGRRIVGYSLLYAAVLEKHKHPIVIYVSEDRKVIQLPLFELDRPLTTLEEEILKVLVKEQGEHGITVSQIAKKLDKNIHLISQYLNRLERKGFIERNRRGRVVYVKAVVDLDLFKI